MTSATESSLRDAMAGVDYVFHAAALKQVPSCEFFPVEALRTNALGTENVLNEAIHARRRARHRAQHGQGGLPDQRHGDLQGDDGEARDREVARRGRPSPTICVTRYGNVMASRGSVIPLFIQQIQSGKPLTITDPAMTRFMMSIEDAVDLVLYAFEHGQPGDTFVQKAASATIETLALAVKKLLKADNPVNVIGTRHGEKLYETLLTREELVGAEDLGGYFRVAADNRDLNYALYFSEGKQDVSRREDYNSHNVKLADVNAMCDLLVKLDCVQKAMRGEKIES